MFLTVVVPWAQEANYSSAGPWNGTPTKVAPVGDIFTPNTKPPAQFFNYLFNQYSLCLGSVYNYAVSTTLQNWCPEFDLLSSDVQLAISWDPADRLWLLVGNNNDVVQLSLSYGLGQGDSGEWVNLATFNASSPPNYGACCNDPTSLAQYFVVYTDSAATHNFADVWQLVAGSWVHQYHSGGSAGYFYGCEVAYLGTGVAFALASTDAHSGILWTTNASSGGWPAGSVWPPTTNFQPFGITAMNVGDTVYMKSNGTQILCIPSTTAAGGYTVWQTTSIGTWTSNSGLASVAPGGGKVVGLAWTQDAVGLCWLVCVQPGSGHPVFFRSADGVVWTAQAGGMTGVFVPVIKDMAAAGSHLKCTLADNSTGGPSGMIFSTDGGLTWSWDQAVLTTNTVLGLNRSRVASSTIGFMSMNGIWCRFSGLAGLPPTQL